MASPLTTAVDDTLLPFTFSLLPSEVAGVSLDVGDNDPVRFWSYAIAALQTVHAASAPTRWPCSNHHSLRR
jgi:hypothetical protein